MRQKMYNCNVGRLISTSALEQGHHPFFDIDDPDIRPSNKTLQIQILLNLPRKCITTTIIMPTEITCSHYLSIHNYKLLN